MPRPPAATRRLGLRDGAEIVGVRRAVLEVVRGPDRGRSLELGEREHAVIGTDPDAAVVLADDSVSRRHAELGLTDEGWILRDLGSTNGTWVGGARVREALLGDAVELTIGESALRFRLIDGEVEARLSLSEAWGGLVARSPAMRRVVAVLERVAPSDATILVGGESGTGKERVAEAIHAASRPDGPFVVVDCSALTPTLAESELFGHEAGAFTGAERARAGALEEASGGTLFLDEVGELPLELQPRLLRALAAREVKPVGASAYRPIDVRVVAATHRDLERLIAAGGFRADLYHRLAVVRVELPPLRRRREDLPVLCDELLAALAPGGPPPRLSDPVRAALAAYAWPGNVRELRNALERLLVVGELDALEPAPPLEGYHAARRRTIDAFERDYVRDRLAEAGGVMARAAAASGISRQMFHRLARRHGAGDDE